MKKEIYSIKCILNFQEKVKQVLGKMCKKLPGIQNQCKEFIDTYGDAIVAILVQQIDPAQVNVFFAFLLEVCKFAFAPA